MEMIRDLHLASYGPEITMIKGWGSTIYNSQDMDTT